MDIIKSIEYAQVKKNLPTLNIGDTVRVHVRVKEGNRERIQVFEGIIIKKQNGGTNETFTVRKISYGVGVEKTFLVHSPRIEKIEIIRVGKVRRAKLYYLRDRVGKAAKTKEKIGARIPSPVKEAEPMQEEVEVTEPVESDEETLEATPELEAKEVVDTVSEEVVEVIHEETPVKKD